MCGGARGAPLWWAKRRTAKTNREPHEATRYSMDPLNRVTFSVSDCQHSGGALCSCERRLRSECGGVQRRLQVCWLFLRPPAGRVRIAAGHISRLNEVIKSAGSVVGCSQAAVERRTCRKLLSIVDTVDNQDGLVRVTFVTTVGCAIFKPPSTAAQATRSSGMKFGLYVNITIYYLA